ncbi:hypothetical protein [Alicyclobacillus acidiphilus]|uniref:hypothetical protein n=1 Tax=Alicyclobacillus acidiphilus TaxID=182455 RepID=UPI00082EE34D|nr:hypothetical protein [Alicyclobacillus acidiphilus]
MAVSRGGAPVAANVSYGVYSRRVQVASSVALGIFTGSFEDIVHLPGHDVRYLVAFIPYVVIGRSSES